MNDLADHCKIAELLSKKNVAKGMRKIIAQYNARVAKQNMDIDKINVATYNEFQNPKISAAEAKDRYVQKLRMAKGKPNHKWAKRFLIKLKWSDRKLMAPGDMLHYNHPKNVEWRSKFQAKVEAKKIDIRLVLNYDKVWRLKYRGPKKPLHKRSSETGKMNRRLSGKSGKAKKLHGTAKELRERQRAENEADERSQGGSDAPSADSIDKSSEGEERKRQTKRRRREGDHPHDEVTVTPILQHRMPHTTTTSIRGDSTPGPLVIVSKEGGFPLEKIKALNDKYKGRAYVMTSGRDTHFMDTDSTVHVRDTVYETALAMRRAELNLPRGDRGGLLFDAFTGNESEGGVSRRAM